MGNTTGSETSTQSESTTTTADMDGGTKTTTTTTTKISSSSSTKEDKKPKDDKKTGKDDEKGVKGKAVTETKTVKTVIGSDGSETTTTTTETMKDGKTKKETKTDKQKSKDRPTTDKNKNTKTIEKSKKPESLLKDGEYETKTEIKKSDNGMLEETVTTIMKTYGGTETKSTTTVKPSGTKTSVQPSETRKSKTDPKETVVTEKVVKDAKKSGDKDGMKTAETQDIKTETTTDKDGNTVTKVTKTTTVQRTISSDDPGRSNIIIIENGEEHVKQPDKEFIDIINKERLMRLKEMTKEDPKADKTKKDEKASTKGKTDDKKDPKKDSKDKSSAKDKPEDNKKKDTKDTAGAKDKSTDKKDNKKDSKDTKKDAKDVKKPEKKEETKTNTTITKTSEVNKTSPSDKTTPMSSTTTVKTTTITSGPGGTTKVTKTSTNPADFDLADLDPFRSNLDGPPSGPPPPIPDADLIVVTRASTNATGKTIPASSGPTSTKVPTTKTSNADNFSDFDPYMKSTPSSTVKSTTYTSGPTGTTRVTKTNEILDLDDFDPIKSTSPSNTLTKTTVTTGPSGTTKVTKTTTNASDFDDFDPIKKETDTKVTSRIPVIVTEETVVMSGPTSTIKTVRTVEEPEEKVTPVIKVTPALKSWPSQDTSKEPIAPISPGIEETKTITSGPTTTKVTKTVTEDPKSGKSTSTITTTETKSVTPSKKEASPDTSKDKNKKPPVSPSISETKTVTSGPTTTTTKVTKMVTEDPKAGKPTSTVTTTESKSASSKDPPKDASKEKDKKAPASSSTAETKTVTSGPNTTTKVTKTVTEDPKTGKSTSTVTTTETKSTTSKDPPKDELKEKDKPPASSSTAETKTVTSGPNTTTKVTKTVTEDPKTGKSTSTVTTTETKSTPTKDPPKEASKEKDKKPPASSSTAETKTVTSGPNTTTKVTKTVTEDPKTGKSTSTVTATETKSTPTKDPPKDESKEKDKKPPVSPSSTEKKTVTSGPTTTTKTVTTTETKSTTSKDPPKDTSKDKDKKTSTPPKETITVKTETKIITDEKTPDKGAKEKTKPDSKSETKTSPGTPKKDETDKSKGKTESGEEPVKKPDAKAISDRNKERMQLIKDAKKPDAKKGATDDKAKKDDKKDEKLTKETKTSTTTTKTTTSGGNKTPPLSDKVTTNTSTSTTTKTTTVTTSGPKTTTKVTTKTTVPDDSYLDDLDPVQKVGPPSKMDAPPPPVNFDTHPVLSPMTPSTEYDRFLFEDEEIVPTKTVIRRTESTEQKTSSNEPPKWKTSPYEPPKSKIPTYEAPKTKTTYYEPPKSKTTPYDPPKSKTPTYEAPKSKTTYYEPPKSKTTTYTSTTKPTQNGSVNGHPETSTVKPAVSAPSPDDDLWYDYSARRSVYEKPQGTTGTKVSLGSSSGKVPPEKVITTCTPATPSDEGQDEDEEEEEQNSVQENPEHVQTSQSDQPSVVESTLEDLMGDFGEGIAPKADEEDFDLSPKKEKAAAEGDADEDDEAEGIENELALEKERQYIEEKEQADRPEDDQDDLIEITGDTIPQVGEAAAAAAANQDEESDIEDTIEADKHRVHHDISSEDERRIEMSEDEEEPRTFIEKDVSDAADTPPPGVMEQDDPDFTRHSEQQVSRGLSDVVAVQSASASVVKSDPEKKDSEIKDREKSDNVGEKDIDTKDNAVKDQEKFDDKVDSTKESDDTKDIDSEGNDDQNQNQKKSGGNLDDTKDTDDTIADESKETTEADSNANQIPSSVVEEAVDSDEARNINKYVYVPAAIPEEDEKDSDEFDDKEKQVELVMDEEENETERQDAEKMEKDEVEKDSDDAKMADKSHDDKDGEPTGAVVAEAKESQDEEDTAEDLTKEVAGADNKDVGDRDAEGGGDVDDNRDVVSTERGVDDKADKRNDAEDGCHQDDAQDGEANVEISKVDEDKPQEAETKHDEVAEEENNADVSEDKNQEVETKNDDVCSASATSVEKDTDGMDDAKAQDTESAEDAENEAKDESGGTEAVNGPTEVEMEMNNENEAKVGATKVDEEGENVYDTSGEIATTEDDMDETKLEDDAAKEVAATDDDSKEVSEDIKDSEESGKASEIDTEAEVDKAPVNDEICRPDKDVGDGKSIAADAAAEVEVTKNQKVTDAVEDEITQNQGVTDAGEDEVTPNQKFTETSADEPQKQVVAISVTEVENNDKADFKSQNEAATLADEERDRKMEEWNELEDEVETDDILSAYPDDYVMPSWPPKPKSKSTNIVIEFPRTGSVKTTVYNKKPSESSDLYEGAVQASEQKQDERTLHYMKSRFEDKEEKQREKITRKPKKLSHGWGKTVQEEEIGPGGKKVLPKEQDLLAFTGFGIDYSKTQYQKKVEDDTAPGTKQTLKPPSRQGDRNRSHSPSPIPVNWARVEKVAPPEITKNVRAIFETGTFTDIHKVRKTRVDDLKKVQGGIYENDPVQLEGVTRETDYNPEPDLIQEGTTKSIKERYLNQERQFRRTKIVLAEATGPECLENEPTVLDGVVRESDELSDANVLKAGITKNKIHEYVNRSQERDYRRGPIDVTEGNAGPDCVENDPVQLEGVVRETDSSLEGEVIQKGFAQNVRNQFMNRKDDFKSRGPVNIREGSGPECFENDPEQRQDVIRESDNLNAESDTIQRGFAKNVKERYLTGNQREIKKIAVNLREATGPECVESEPLVRDDVIREGDTQEEVIQKGYAQNLKHKYLNAQGKEIKKVVVNLQEDQGSTCENQPEVREDVVRESDGQVETIEAGYTKNLKHKYLNYKGKEIRKTAINLCEAEGPECIENTPEVRTDVIREADRDLEQDTIQLGYAKNLKQQYLNYKGKEVQKLQVNLAEGQGPSSFENEPDVRTDVVREGDRDLESDTVQRGLAKNLKNQYLNYKGKEVQKVQVNLKEGQGPETFENEPEVRSDVIREGDLNVESDTIQRGTAQNIKQQYLNSKGREVKKLAVNLNEGDDCCIESTPEVRSDVVRETDYNPDSDTVQRGTAQNIKQQYLNYKGREVKKLAVNLNEGEDCCIESTPEVRTDVIRESDYNPDADTVQRGTAQNIKQQYLNYKGKQVQKLAVNLKEGEDCCIESTPEVRTDVIRESDYNPDADTVQKGTAQNIKQQYLNSKGKEIKKLAVNLNEGEDCCIESNPEVRTDVIRESDYNPEADTVQKGTAQNIKQQYLNSKGKEIKKIAVNLNEGQDCCVESTPEVRSDVVREGDYNPEPDTIERGTAQNIKQQYLNYKGRQVQKVAVNLNEGQDCCIESTPEVRTDVVRESDYDPEADTIHKGTAQNVKQQYLNYKGREVKKVAVNLNEGQGPECVENNPDVRTDVVRESDYNPTADTINRGTAQNIKQQYLNNKGKEIKKVAVNLNEGQGPECVENQPQVRQDVIRESDYDPEADTILRGTAKNIKNQYLNYKGRQVQKTAINLREAEGPECIENNPEVRTDVVRETDYNPQADTVTKGTAQNVKQQYLNYKGRQVEKTAINLYEAQGPEVLENQPEVRTDVIRETDYDPESDSVQRGIAGVAKQRYLNDKGNPVQRTEIEKWENEAPSCYENEPEVRDDVVRELDTRYISPSEASIPESQVSSATITLKT